MGVQDMGLRAGHRARHKAQGTRHKAQGTRHKARGVWHTAHGRGTGSQHRALLTIIAVRKEKGRKKNTDCAKFALKTP